jgi:hypothetical protein
MSAILSEAKGMLEGSEVELTTASPREAKYAWPDVSFNGVSVFDAYMKVTDKIYRELRKIDKAGGQSGYLGWSEKTGQFISGWDWAHGTGYAVLEMGKNGKFKIISVDLLSGPLYNTGLAKLASKFNITHHLRES